MNSKKHTWSPERQMEIPRVRKIDGEIERSVRSEWVGFASVCMRAPTFPCAPSTPLLAPVCRFVFFVSLKRMHVFKECLCTRVWLCVGCSSGGGKGFAKDIKKGKKTFFFFFPFVCKRGGASFSALSHGHKDDSDNPFIFLTSCRLREDRWLLPRLFMALLISHSQSWGSLSPNPPPLSLAIAHPAESLSLSCHFSVSIFSPHVFLSWSVWILMSSCLVGLFIEHLRITPWNHIEPWSKNTQTQPESRVIWKRAAK